MGIRQAELGGTHSQAELGNDRVRGEAALRKTHSQAALGNDRVRGEAALRKTHSQAALGNDKGLFISCASFLSVVVFVDLAANFFSRSRTGARWAAVNPLQRATFSGGPEATNSPPPAPPLGPKSKSQSAVFITSMLCSITTTVLPWSAKRFKTSSNIATS